MLDASALIELLLQTHRSAAVLYAIGSSEMAAPDLINIEVVSRMRSRLRSTLSRITHPI